MPDGSGLEHLPYGVVRAQDGAARVVARLRDEAIPLAPLAHAGALEVPPGTFDEPSLNRFIGLGHEAWAAVGAGLRDLVQADRVRRVPLSGTQPVLAFHPGDYVDFYASLEHATTVGRLFRPDAPDPLPAAWRHLPIGYHGRAGTVVVSGTDVRRPSGQRAPGDFGPERRLDFELELGFVCGDVPAPVAAGDAGRHLFGVVLVNDWSAREIQRMEYQPLGPFLGKSFCTSVSAWVVPFDALPRVAGPPQDPEPLPHLRTTGDQALDVELEVALNGEVVTRVNARGLYWSAAQQLAHLTSNGSAVRAGDLLASGTISGWEPGTQGCLLERGGPFLEDGDEVVLRGRAGSLALGEVRGTIVPR